MQFELSAPFSAFISNLAATTMYIYAKEAGKPTADGGRDYTAADTVIGTGPFMLEEYREKQRHRLQAQPAYFEPGRPYLDGVEVYFIADSSAQLAALRTGKIDLIPVAAGQGLPHSLAAEARAIPGATVIKQSLFQTSENVIGRLDQKPWSDVRVRRAVSLAMDRASLMKAMYPEGADSDLRSDPRHLALHHPGRQARGGGSVLPVRSGGGAGAAGGGRLSRTASRPSSTPPSGYGPEYVSRTELLKDMLSRIGIDASIVVQEYPVWISGTYKGNYEGLVHIPDVDVG